MATQELSQHLLRRPQNTVEEAFQVGDERAASAADMVLRERGIEKSPKFYETSWVLGPVLHFLAILPPQGAFPTTSRLEDELGPEREASGWRTSHIVNATGAASTRSGANESRVSEQPLGRGSSIQIGDDAENGDVDAGDRFVEGKRSVHCTAFYIFHVFLVFAAAIFGFYSLNGTTDGRFTSDLLTAVNDASYPLCYLALQVAVRRRAVERSLNRFVALWHHDSGTLGRGRSVVFAVDAVTVLLVLSSIVWAALQKQVYYEHQRVWEQTWGSQLLFYVFAITEAIRITIAGVSALLPILVIARFALESRAFVRRYFNGVRVTNFNKFHASYLAIVDECKAAAAAVSPMLAALILTTIASAVALLVAILFDFIDIEVFWEDSSDLFVLVGFSALAGAVALYTDSRLAALPRAIRVAHLLNASTSASAPAIHDAGSLAAFALAVSLGETPAFHAIGIEIRASTVAKTFWSLISFSIIVAIKATHVATST